MSRAAKKKTAKKKTAKKKTAKKKTAKKKTAKKKTAKKDRSLDPFAGVPTPWIPHEGMDQFLLKPLTKMQGYPCPNEVRDEDISPSYKSWLPKALWESGRKLSQEGWKSLFVKITPKFAKEILTYRVPNRNPKMSVVGRYAADMLNGKWDLSGQPIIFDESFRLLDGLHRLCAVVEADTPIESFVVTGVNRDSFLLTDVGSARSLQDIGSTFRKEDGNRVEGNTPVCRGIALALKYSRTLSAKRMARDKTNSRFSFDVLHDNHFRWESAFHFYKGLKDKLNILGINDSVAICSLYFTCDYSFKKADAFWEQLACGFDLKRTSPILAIREYLTKFRAEREKQHTREAPKVAQEWFLDVIIQGWNMFVSNKSCRKPLEPTSVDLPFPRFKGSEEGMEHLLKVVHIIKADGDAGKKGRKKRKGK
jgi:hypothetical protein